MLPTPIIIASLILLSICAAWFLFKLIAVVRGKEDKVKLIFPIIVTVIFFIANVGIQITFHADPDFAILNKPNLIPSLIIDRLSESTYGFHFVIENKGNYPAINIQYILVAPGFRSAEFSDVGREVAKNSRIRLNLNEIPLPIGNSSLRFELTLLYRTNMHNTVYSYQSIFRFKVLPKDIEKNPHMHDAETSRDGWMPIKNRFEVIQYKEMFLREEGTMQFDLDETVFDQKETSVLISEANKLLLYNPQRRKISYQVLKNNREVIELTKTLANNMTHSVVIRWSPDRAALTVNGEHIYSK